MPLKLCANFVCPEHDDPGLEFVLFLRVKVLNVRVDYDLCVGTISRGQESEGVAPVVSIKVLRCMLSLYELADDGKENDEVTVWIMKWGRKHP